MKKLFSFFLLVLILAGAKVQAQLVISPGGGAAGIISAVGGPGLTISNVTVNCNTSAYGSYSGASTAGLGGAMTSGLVMGTGNVSQLPGSPGALNNDDWSTCIGGSSTDPQLVSVIGAGTAIYDPCIIEFDVVPQCNSLSIRFVFGSDEYTNWVSAGFNDGFGFFVSGPNPGGGNYTNYNMAILPGGTQVSIDNVNNTTNSGYFVNNNSGTYANHFDGFTTVLTPSINVTPCATYHFKLAIADASDCYVDSGVMVDIIQCVSPWTVATSSTPASCGTNNGTATATVSGGIGPFTYSWAPSGGTGATASGLAAGSYTVTVNDGLSCTPAQTYTVVVGGSGGSPVTVNSQTICAGSSTTLTATPTTGGGTYSWAPGGMTTQTITVSPAATTTYTVTYTLTGCATTNTGTVTVNPVPTVSVNSQTICAGSSTTLTATPSITGGTYSWAPGGMTTQTITVSPGTTTTYTVTYTLAGCTNNGTGTVTVNPVPTVSVNSQTICAGSSATLTATPSITGGTYSWAPGGMTTQTITISPASTTTYTVTYTLAGCTNTGTGTVTVNPVPTVSVNSQTICAGSSTNLTATPSITGGTYSWAPGGMTTQTITISPSTTTTYTVTYTLAGCTNTGTGTVTVNSVPTITVNSPTICPGQNATLTATGGTTYSWTPGGSTTNPITVSPASTTTYTVTGTTSGCSSTAVATVTVGSSMTITVNSPTICAGQSATLTATGGTTYSWNTGSTSNPLTVSPATTTSYTVTGTTGGCSGTAVATVTVTPLPTVSSTSSTICNGQTTSLTASGATTYSWNTGASGSNLTVTPSSTTTYTVTGTTSGCSNTATGTVTVNPVPTITVNSPTTCPGTSATLTASGGTTYSWSTGATTNPITVSPATTTSYTVTGTTLGCSNTAVATVTIGSAMIVNAGVDDTICYGGNIVLNASPVAGGNTYLWSPSTGLSATNIPNPTASPTSTTNYTVTITDALGCTGNDNVTVYVDAQLTTAIAGINVTCNGANNGQVIVIPAGGTSPYTYLWNTGCTTPSCNGLAPGSYTVTVTDAWGCTIVDDTVVTQPTLLTISTTGTTATTCNGACDGTATAAANGGTTTYSYSWNTIPVQNTATATGLCAGTYTCTVTDANGCTATTTATITQPTPVVIAPIANVTICNGGNTVLTASASGGTAGYTYSWSPATGLSATNVANPTASPASTTTYTVTATDANGCAAPGVTVTVTVNPLLSVIANGTASICPGASTPISAVASNGNGGPYTYSWSPAAGLSNANIANPTASPAGTTTYTVTATDGCSPAVTATVTVTVLPNPTVVFAADVLSGCAPLCVNFTDASNVAGGTISTWNWSFGGDGTSTLQNPTHCFANAGSYSITLTVVDNSGCTSTFTNNNMINVYPIPNANFSAPISASILNPLVQFTDNSTGASTWNWNFGDNILNPTTNTSSQQNPSHLYSETGTYCATLIVSNGAGCVDTTQLCIVIDPEFTFFIPNAFSPNGDGVNDFFFGKGEFIKEYEMSIFDRWGNLIFFADDINKYWDGRANHGSDIAQQDVYVYVVKLKDNKNVKHKYIGSVTLVK